MYSCHVFACMMAMVTGSFINFTQIMKSNTIEFLLIIIIIGNIIRPCGITMKLSGIKFIITITITVMVIVIIINIIKSCSINMNFSDIKFFIITTIIAIIIMVIVIIINIIKSCSITRKPSKIKFLSFL